VASTEAMAEALTQEVGPTRPVTVIGDAVETSIEGIRLTPWARWLARWRLRHLLAGLGREAARTPLVWFGSHGGPSGDHGMGDLESIRPVIESLDREQPVSLTVISNSVGKYERLIRPWTIPTRYLPWSADTFFAALRHHRIAVLPIRQNPFTRCKTNNRLVTALAAGLAVVATGIPSYRPFAGCCVLDDWSGGLRRYILDAEERRREVAAGQRLVERDWLLPAIADQWQRLLDGLRQVSSG
jgi:glycosyltransferase involved in cell wall biosynthesis